MSSRILRFFPFFVICSLVFLICTIVFTPTPNSIPVPSTQGEKASASSLRGDKIVEQQDRNVQEAVSDSPNTANNFAQYQEEPEQTSEDDTSRTPTTTNQYNPIPPRTLSEMYEQGPAHSGGRKLPATWLQTLMLPSYTPDGSVKASSPTYSVLFDDRGTVRFMPRFTPATIPASSTPLSVEYTFREISLSGTPIFQEDTGKSLPIIEGNHVLFPRSPLITEKYVILDNAIEQMFVIHHYPGHGDLEISGVIETAFETRHGSESEGSYAIGFYYEGELVATYGKATAIDADGRHIEAPVTLADGRLGITVPSEWLATASYPVVIDPLIGTSFQINPASAVNEQSPDVAFNRTTNEYLVVWQYNFSATDRDIYARRVSANGTPLGTTIEVTIGQADETRPRVAWDQTSNRYLVVWERQDGTATASNKNIYGRLINANGTFAGTSFQITYAARDDFDPDVGAAPNMFLVVWTHSSSDAGTPDTADDDYDIYARRVNANGTFADEIRRALRTPQTQERNPAVNQYTAGNWLVAWQTNGLTTIRSWDIEVRTVSTTGAIGNLNVVTPDSPGYNDGFPDVAGWSDFVVTFVRADRDTPPRANQILARRCNPNGAPQAPTIIIEGTAGIARGWPCVAVDPSLTPGGAAFIAWEDGRNGDWDIYGRLLSTGNTVIPRESAFAIYSETGNANQHRPQVASTSHSEYLVVFLSPDPTITNFEVFGQRFGDPTAPSLSSPANGQVGVSPSPTLSWTASESYAPITYALQVDTENTFSLPLTLNVSGITETSYVVPGGILSPNTLYYWRVNASSSVGTSPWSTVWSFTTIAGNTSNYNSTDTPRSIPNNATITSTINIPDNITIIDIQVSVNISHPWIGDLVVRLRSPANTEVTLHNATGGDADNIVTTFDSLRPPDGPGTMNDFDGQNAQGNWTLTIDNPGVDAGTLNSWNIQITTSGTAPPSQPVLVSPANDATGVSLTPTLSWTASSGPAPITYTVQVDTDANFQAPLTVNASGISGTSYTVGSGFLTPGTLYYWRVQATNAFGQSPWSLVRNFTTGIAPGLPTLSLPLNNASGTTLTPTFSWGAPATGTTPFTYAIQVDDADDFSSPAVDISGLSSTSYTPTTPLAQGTLYYWRVRAINAFGTSGWTTTTPNVERIFTTGIQPSAPTLTSPTNGATGQPTSLTLQWSAPTTGTTPLTYQVQVDDNSDFSSPFINQTDVTSTSLAVSGLSNSTTYYWRVRASNLIGTGPWSATWSFTTTGAQVAPTQPVLTSPANGSTGVTLTPTFVWQTSAGSPTPTYTIQVDNNADFSSPEVNQSGLSSTSYTVPSTTPLTANTVYYWRVQATNAAGTSPWSSVWSFTTETAGVIPSPPVLSSPPNGSTVSLTPTLVWEASSGTTPISYSVEVDDNNDFSSVLWTATTAATIVNVPSGILTPGTQYFWRVRGSNSIGTGAWSAPRSFTVGTLPSVPTNPTPANGATNQPTSLTLGWTASTGTTPITYRVQLDDTSDFSSPLIDQSAITTNSFAVSGLSNNRTYYWRVNATNIVGTSAWSSPSWQFSTALAAGAPTAFNLLSPSNGASGVPLNPTLSWEPASGASPITYTVRVYTSDPGDGFPPTGDPGDGFPPTGTVVNVSGLTGTSYTIPVTSLSANTLYYWRVQATNAVGSTLSSGTRWTFTTGGPPGAPTASSPSGTGILTSPTFIWTAPTTGTQPFTYNLQVDNNDNFSSPEINQSGITTTSYEVTGLATGTRYWWRVSARNAFGTSPWSNVLNFETVTGGVPPTPPALASPSNGATGVSLTPTLTWSASTGTSPINYTIQVDDNNDFSSPIWSTTTTATSTSVPSATLAPGTQYYWRIRGTNALGSSAWSAIWSFTTGTSPSVPVLASPANGATDVLLTPTLTWIASTGTPTITYDLQVDNDENFSPPVVTASGISTASYTISPALPQGTRYYWRVRASNAFGTSPWSSIASFTTGLQPSVPVLTSPIADARGVSTSPTLSWRTSTGTPPITYRVQIDDSGATFPSPEVDVSNISGTSYGASGLAFNTRYYWRVQATNPIGTSNFSEVRSFTTIGAADPPTVPTLFSPANLATNVSLSPTLFWNPSTGPGTITYSIQVATDNTFSNRSIVASGSGISRTRFGVTGLSEGTQYFWRVRAANQTGESDWSSPWTFSTGTSPTAPTLSSPANNATNVATSVALRWSAPASGTLPFTYNLQIAQDTGFTNIVADIAGIERTSHTVSLRYNTRYYWRVRATNSIRTGIWSAVWTFTTEAIASHLPTTPVPMRPPDGARGQLLNPTLSWQASTGSAPIIYTVEVAQTPQFDVILFRRSDLQENSVVVTSGLTYGEKYLWRVRASNRLGQSDWTTPWQFSTIRELWTTTDAFGYTGTNNVDYNWIEIAQPGTSIAPLADNAYVEVPLEFDFQFYGTTYDRVFVGSNGFLAFEYGSDVWGNSPVPDPRKVNNVIAGYWDDLRLDLGGTIYYGTYGTAPNRYFIAKWHQVPITANDRTTFEIILYEGSNEIRIQYGPQVGAAAGGSGATVGIENLTGTTGIQYLYNYPDGVYEGLALKFTPPTTAAAAQDRDGDGGACFASLTSNPSSVSLLLGATILLLLAWRAWAGRRK